MQTATSETESKSLDLRICVHHYTLRAPCPEGQGKLRDSLLQILQSMCDNSKDRSKLCAGLIWMQETDRPLETSADNLNQVPGLNKEEVANRCAYRHRRYLEISHG